MSDIRFNNWKHQSGTGGVAQDSGGQVGIGSTIPSATLDVGGNAVFTGIITASSFVGNVTGGISGGAVSGSTGTFSSNVTIDGNLGVGGTITYEDVARVDATGLSTFREGFGVGPLAGIALTAYKDGSIRTSGIVTASSFVGSGANLTDLSSAEIYGFTGIGSHLEVRTTNKGVDNVTGAQYAAFEQVMFAASGITWSINNNGNLIATI